MILLLVSHNIAGKTNRMQTITYQIDSLGREIPVQLTPAAHSLFSFFIEGSPWFMTLLSLLFIALLFAAWKAPAWVREIGEIAAVAGCFFSLVALYQMFEVISLFGDTGPTVLSGGLKCSLLPLSYGLLIDFLSLVIRLIQKPRR